MDSNMDWFETPRPTGTPLIDLQRTGGIEICFTEVRSYIFEALMYLVSVHAHVSVVAKPLLERTLSSLIEDLVEEALACFKQVRRFGMGGMLRVIIYSLIPLIHVAVF